jgi:hypothetical protein
VLFVKSYFYSFSVLSVVAGDIDLDGSYYLGCFSRIGTGCIDYIGLEIIVGLSTKT